MTYKDRPQRIGSVGHPMPYSQVKVIKLDAAGQYAGDCAVNEVGVIAMSGPGVFSGYLSAVHNVGAFSEPGWVNSGDLGRLDEEGYLWITGREKDLIIRGGHNIDPMPIEEIFYQHPAVALVALVGQPDAYAGEVPLAYVQLKPGATTTPDELLAHVRAHTPERAAVPVEVRLIDSVPLTGVGKVFKPALRWAAAEAVFAKLLAPLSTAEHLLTVSVGAHGQHGSVARVQCKARAGSGLSVAAQESLTDQVAQVFKPFVMRHELVF
jgi:fatty-acyl-CoA synthase